MTKFALSPRGSRRKANSLSRRRVLGGAVAGAAALYAPAVLGQKTARVVVVGGGFAGGTAARTLAREGGISVTLVEPQAQYTACPLSNSVVAGLRDLKAQQFDTGMIARDGIAVVRQRAVGVDQPAKRLRLENGEALEYDRLILAPGVDLRFDVLKGYDQKAAEVIPHAWKAGEQTLLLRRQLEAMTNGGVVVMSVPANPYRCPPGPYERASLIAHYLKTKKPRSKLIILDGKDTFSKQKLFEAAWKELYPGLIEWVPLSSGGAVIEVDAGAKTLITDFGKHRAAVANVIPPQRAGEIAHIVGVADKTGWCPVDPVTFESRLQPNIHVIGDAIIAGGMPKSAFSANSQAKVCASAVAQLLAGETPAPQKLINTCYSLVGPDYGISIAGVFTPKDGVLTEVAGGVSPMDKPAAFRAEEARHAEAWFETITRAVYG